MRRVAFLNRQKLAYEVSTISPNGCFGSILLKKPAMVCASEKYAPEIEIFTLGRGFRTRISRSSVQKRCFLQSMIRQFGQTDFFNRIGRKRPSNSSESS